MNHSDGSSVLLESTERLAYLALALAPGMGPARLRRVRDACGSYEAVLDQPVAILTGRFGLDVPTARAAASASLEAARQVSQRVEELGGLTLLPGDPEIPVVLGQIPHPPTHLFAVGRLDLLRMPAVAIVGTRHPTRYGRDVCARLAATAAAAGLSVVSGMARGLDAVAHQSALEAGGGSVGVLGNGLDVVYPASNRRLYHAMRTAGLLVTEFLPGTRPVEGSFQRRNRLISGLARVTVVVEAGPRSGALITAGTALEQGREVLAVPGPITSTVSVGTNRLLRDGAAPLLELDDLFAHYPETRVAGAAAASAAGDASPTGRVLAALQNGPRQVDELASTLGLAPADTLSLLAALEIQDLVRQEPGMMFRAARPLFAAEASP